jgi:hypothetical protein
MFFWGCNTEDGAAQAYRKQAAEEAGRQDAGNGARGAIVTATKAAIIQWGSSRSSS